MARYRPGTVVLVSFPFTDRKSSKVRPALVLTSKADDVIILGIFSRVPYQMSESWIKLEEEMEGFTQTGLKKTSLVKTEKITVIHEPNTASAFAAGYCGVSERSKIEIPTEVEDSPRLLRGDSIVNQEGNRFSSRELDAPSTRDSDKNP